MAYRTPHQFGRAPLPPGLGDIALMGRGTTVEDPIEASMDEQPSFESPRFDDEPHMIVPDPQPIGAAKIGQYKQLGAAGGEKVSTFFQHPLTHLSVGTLTGVVLADSIPEAVMDRLFKANGITLLITSLATFGVLSVMYK